MKRVTLFSIPIILALATACGPANSEETEAPEMNENTKVSYAIGWQNGLGMSQQGIELDLDEFVQGMRDALAGAEGRYSEEEMQVALQAFQREMMTKQQAKMEAEAAENQEAGSAFLADVAQRSGVTTTESGLLYEVITEGAGAKPTATSQVTVHYTGTLIDGSEFDSSVRRGQPATFGLNAVIAGWTEGVQLMSVGSKYKFYVPSELGYGLRGSPPKIGPGAALIFEIELLDAQ